MTSSTAQPSNKQESSNVIRCSQWCWFCFQKERTAECPICAARMREYEHVFDHVKKQHANHKNSAHHLNELKVSLESFLPDSDRAWRCEETLPFEIAPLRLPRMVLLSSKGIFPPSLFRVIRLMVSPGSSRYSRVTQLPTDLIYSGPCDCRNDCAASRKEVVLQWFDMAGRPAYVPWFRREKGSCSPFSTGGHVLQT